jgi:hypothetical protein
LTTAPVPRIATCGWVKIGVSNSAATAGVGEREGRPAQLVRADLVGAGALGEVSDLARDDGEVEIARVVDDRNEQSARGVDGDAEVFGVVVGDGLGVRVDGGVHDRMGLERLDGGDGEERQEAQLDTFASLEVPLGGVTQSRDPGDVHLGHGGQLCGRLQRLDHARRDDLPHARHRFHRSALGGRR